MPEITSEFVYMGLSLMRNIGGARVRDLSAYFVSAAAIWTASEEELQSVSGIGPKLAFHIVAERRRVNPTPNLEWAKAKGFSVVPYDSPSYPLLLRQIADPPAVLYVWGRVPEQPGIAVVGTRRPTRSGQQQAAGFSRELAAAGLPVVSGLARGIDCQAHLGALGAGGQTAAVLGSPLDSIYPLEHQELAERIAGSGCVLSELHPGTPILPSNFPVRNRLIAGMTQGVLIVEAPLRSGAVTTADSAASMGREVWTIPGDIGNYCRRGNHMLLRSGAGLVESPREIMASLRHQVPMGEVDMPPLRQQLLDSVRSGLSVDEIIEVTGLPVSEVQSQLALMEVEGLI